MCFFFIVHNRISIHRNCSIKFIFFIVYVFPIMIIYVNNNDFIKNNYIMDIYFLVHHYKYMDFNLVRKICKHNINYLIQLINIIN